MTSNTQKEAMNRLTLDRRDILATGLAVILVINLIFTSAYFMGLYPKYQNWQDWEIYEYSTYYIIWGISSIFSFAYSVLWAYITCPLNRWAVFALLISTITIIILGFDSFLLRGVTIFT